MCQIKHVRDCLYANKYTQKFSLDKEKSHWSNKKQSLDFYFCMVLVVTLFNIKDRCNNNNNKNKKRLYF